MIEIRIEEAFKKNCPGFVGASVSATFENSSHNRDLWQEVLRFQDEYRQEFDTESLKSHPAISATREAYKRCGKDPSRYRPSSEALIRRMLKGNDLYRVNTAVDLINLASIRYGYPIGGFDREKIQGELLCLGIGRKDEEYEGIGRGPLNIENMPVYRDSAGGIGTPTSDNERTKLSLDSGRLLAIVNGYDGNREKVAACARYIGELLDRYCRCSEKEISMFSA